jgi:hypothetical protein
MPEDARRTRRHRISRWLLRVLIAFRGPVWCAAAAGPAADPPLPTCAACQADCACPLDWEPEDSEHWWIRLRCGECGHVREVIAENADAARFERHLAWQTSKIERALARLDRERMAAEIEQFVAALAGDLVDAGDFEP